MSKLVWLDLSKHLPFSKEVREAISIGNRKPRDKEPHKLYSPSKYCQRCRIETIELFEVPYGIKVTSNEETNSKRKRKVVTEMIKVCAKCRDKDK